LPGAFSLFARDVQIIIEDIELNLPLEGAMIRSWDGRQYICDENGKALISVPDERQVVIQAAYPGYENGRLVIVPGTGEYILGLRLSGIMEGRELVIEAARPGTSETRTGRSVAVSGRDIAQTAEIGVIEDVMSSVKLLPGVGYAGFFDAQPSIRGGDPGDMSASLDGFYISNPYHWDGGFSIFDPRMVQSAQLSHGVFSSRYGHTISGLLDISAKKPSPTEIEFELGANTSAANFNLSLPLSGKSSASRGGILFMGRITYYDPVIALAQEMSKVIKEIEIINSIRVAPYIRSGTITGNYRFFDNLEFSATGFWGMDGVGVTYENSSYTSILSSSSNADFDWTHYQGFITAGLSWNPRNDMLLKFSTGTGYEDSVVNGEMLSQINNKHFSDFFMTNYYDKYLYLLDDSVFINPYQYSTTSLIRQSDFLYNAQARVDYDWELGNGFLFAAGIQEMFTLYNITGIQQMNRERRLRALNENEQNNIFSQLGIDEDAILVRNFLKENLFVNFPAKYEPDLGNKLFTTSGYILAEYHTPDNRLKTELGLRVDHLYLAGDGFTLQSKPALNPRLNLDYNIFKNRWIFQSLDISAGTGLFSSVNDNIASAEKNYNLTEAKPNRSWTSVFGARLEFPEGLSFNIEAYYKYIFDRTYVPVTFNLEELDIRPRFDGEGRVWGIDILLQKLQSRYWDGWLSYSFSWAQYRDPSGILDGMGLSGGNRGDDWYFPSYHRFHNLNLVLNVKPVPRINIYTRFGLASGVQISRRIGNSPISYPVYVSEGGTGYFIEKYYWPSQRDENNRTTPSFLLDIKFSLLGKNNDTKKTRSELYVAVENVLALLYTSQGNTSFNQYTGQVDTGSMSASYDIPIPIPSFGFKYSY
jgi:hypothetical protein